MSILDNRPWYYVIYEGPDSYIGVTDYLAAVAYDRQPSLSFMTQQSRLLNYLKKGRADYKASIRLARAIRPASVAGYGNYLVRQKGHLSPLTPQISPVDFLPQIKSAAVQSSLESKIKQFEEERTMPLMSNMELRGIERGKEIGKEIGESNSRILASADKKSAKILS